MKQINLGSRQFNLYSFTGKVLSVTKNLETRVHGGGGGGQGGSRVSISSSTTVHDQLFLGGKDGTEKAFQLQDFDVACREGNQVTVLWAIKAGYDKGRYVTVYNHTTQAVRFDDSSIKRLVAPSGEHVGIGVAALLLPFLIYLGGFMLYGLLGGATAVDGRPSLVPVAMMVLIFPVLIIVVLIAIFEFGWYWQTANKRARQFKAAINIQELASA